MPDQQTCFVVMGFGEKVDFETGRKLNLDASYKNVIKPAIEAAGLVCIRADEIAHSGVIDVPMYERILLSDLVVADVSTANCNAFYELGVRHALRPYTTIIICEDQFKFPFDINRNKILKYKHLGEDVGAGEAKRFAAELKDAVTEILAQTPPPDDSPVYTFLRGLRRLRLPDDFRPGGDLQNVAVAQAAANSNAAAVSVTESTDTVAMVGAVEVAPDQTHRALMQQVDEAQKNNDFEKAKALLIAVRALRPDDAYIAQRLALVTYKNKKQPAMERLNEARALLATLNPETSNDTETLGLWGAVHKNLWNETREAKQLDESIRGYERGFYLRNDYYNGINFAFLLNVRAAHRISLAKASNDPDEIARERAAAIADFVKAERVRDEALSICHRWLESNPVPDEKVSAEAKAEYLKNKYWYVATKAEAYLGMARMAEAEKFYDEAYSFAPEGWMIETTKAQRANLEKLLADSPLKYVRTDDA